MQSSSPTPHGELVKLLWDYSNGALVDARLRSLLRQAADALEAQPSETNALAEARAEIEAFVAGKDSEDDIAPSAIEPKLNPALLPALPGQKALTVCMFKDDGDVQADAAIEAMKRGDTFLLPQGVPDMFFHQLRLRVALEPSLADKIAVYYLQPENRAWKAVPIATLDDQLRWPVGFQMDGWEKEIQISAARGGSDSVDTAKKIAAELRDKYGLSDGKDHD